MEDKCSKCDTILTEDNQYPSDKEKKQHYCKICRNKISNENQKKNNKKQTKQFQKEVTKEERQFIKEHLVNTNELFNKIWSKIK